MSAQESGKTFAIPELDCQIIRGLVDRLATAQSNVEKQIASLVQARANYDQYMARLAPDVDISKYQVNFVTKQIEPIPPPPAPRDPVRSPDADLPPAPFREADKLQ